MSRGYAPSILVFMLSTADLDEILTLQLAVAWAGETSDEDKPRLGWWRSDLVSKYGGIALFKLIAPRTAEWAAFEAAREAARRVDAEKRSSDATPDRLISLYHLGFEIDEQLEDRLVALKHACVSPAKSLPRLAELPEHWDRAAFAQWLATDSKPKIVQEPSGLRLVGDAPASAVERARLFSAVLTDVPERYPCPHIRDVSTS